MRINGTTIAITAHNPSLQIYNVVVDVVRPVRVTTSTGISESTSTLISNLPCAIEWKNENERILFDKETYFLDAVLTCRNVAGVTVKTSDRVVYRSDVFEIVGVIDIDNLGRRLRIALRRIK